MNILVMGGTQFNGLHLTRALFKKGHQVSVFNRGHTPADLPMGVQRFFGDRYDSAQISRAIGQREFDIVFDVSGYFPQNIEMVAQFFSGRIGRYIFFSSTAVYSKSEQMPISESHPVNTGSFQSDYGRNKVKCEDILIGLSEKKKLGVTVIRPPMIMGSHNPLIYREQKMFARILQGRPILIAGNGETKGQICHVSDQAEALVRMVDIPSTNNQTYNLTAMDPFTDLEYVSTFSKVLNVPAHTVLVSDNHVPHMQKRLKSPPIQRPEIPFYSWNQHLYYTDEKLKKALGWQPRHDLESSVSESFEWYLKQRKDMIQFDFSDEEKIINELERNEV